MFHEVRFSRAYHQLTMSTYRHLITIMHGTYHDVHDPILTSSLQSNPERHAPFPRRTSKRFFFFMFFFLFSFLGWIRLRKSPSHALSGSPCPGMVHRRCTPALVFHRLPNTIHSYAPIAMTTTCPTAAIEQIKLRHSNSCYSPPPTLSLFLTTLSPTSMIPPYTTTIPPGDLSTVKIDSSYQTGKDFSGGVSLSMPSDALLHPTPLTSPFRTILTKLDKTFCI